MSRIGGVDQAERLRWTGGMGDGNDDLDAVYGLKTPEDNRRHYDGWAGSYDSDFVTGMDYCLPERVAEAFAAAGPKGSVLDVGAGTGLVGQALARLGVGPVEGMDISPGMLAEAAKKGVYARLFEGDVMARLPVADDAFASAVSAGTFTNGHVGPEGLAEVIRVVRPGGLIALSINGVHWDSAGFAAAFDALAGRIDGFRRTPVRYYGEAASGTHADDTGWIVFFRPV